jgi:parallel beta-helix repeat protein
VIVRAGTYGPFVIRRSGSVSAPITFMAYPGESPVVDGRGSVDYTVKLSGVRHVLLSGLTVQGGYAERQAGGGIMVAGSSNVIVRGNLVRDNHSFGIRSYDSDHVLIDDNEITGNAVGVTIGRGNEGTVVSNNLIHDNNQMMVNTADVRGDDAGAEGVTIVRSTGHVVVSGNYIWGNRARSYDYGWDGGAFSIHASSNWTITSNVTWDNRNVLETGTDAGTPCDGGRFTRNLNYAATTVDRTVGMVLRCASNTLVANNTFHGMQFWVFAISHYLGSWGGSVEGLRIVNNVVSVSSAKIYGIDSQLPDSVVIDHNLVHNAGAGYLATVLGKGTASLSTFTTWTGFEEHGLGADPHFVDASAFDFELRPDSPAVDSGRFLAGVTDGYVGTAPDRGFAERR